MRISGSFDVTASVSAVYAFLTDPARVIAALPDIQSSKVESSEAFTVVAKVGAGPIRGTMEVKFRLAETESNTRALFKARGGGMGSTVDMDTGFTLAPLDQAGTRVDWYGDAKIGGRLAAVGGGLLEPLASKNIKAFVAAVQRAIDAPEVAA
jgi:carbon monoxide dehydrogenase subunit G